MILGVDIVNREAGEKKEALGLGCGIWSNDTLLKGQKAVAVHSTKDMIQMLG